MFQTSYNLECIKNMYMKKENLLTLNDTTTPDKILFSPEIHKTL